MRFFITLSYDGTRYHGWQIQPNGDSVQQRLQAALSTLLRQPIEVVGAGRTDTGVHAKMMVAHFELPCTSIQTFPTSPSDSPKTPTDSLMQGKNQDTNAICTSPYKGEDGRGSGEDGRRSSDDGRGSSSSFIYRLNRLLPPDIAVQDVRQVADDMHARFSATSRTYHYYVHLYKDPFLQAYSWQVPYKLDFARMNEAAQVLLDYKDFTSFSKTGTDVKTNLCDITEAYWQEVSPGQWRFTITANRFLRNMVRAIVGTLVEIGRSRMNIEEMRKVIEAKDRCQAGESVPGKGLFLARIRY